MSNESAPNASPGAPASEDPAAFAPDDYTDGRSVGEWKTKYPLEAIRGIRIEAAYVTFFFFFYCAMAFVGLYYSAEGSAVIASPATSGIEPANAFLDQTKLNAPVTNNGRWLPAAFLGFCCAWAGGGVGGSLYGLKWMYHSVAKRIWHQDRRLWRFLTPHISAALATFMVLVVSSGLINVFDRQVAVRHVDVMAFAFLVGLFSDKALAKLSEVADTLFGPVKHQQHGKNGEPPRSQQTKEKSDTSP